ncbi:MAG: hypothetical protein ACI82J_002084 [Sulfitobacter litoralis]
MRFEHVLALFRPYRINAAERKIVQRRAAPLGGQMTMDGQVQNGERWISTLETKAGVVLAHISMMIAVTGILFAINGEAEGYRLVLAIELTAYLFLALLCIRCQNHYGTTDFLKFVRKRANPKHDAAQHVYQNAVFGELFYREWLFRYIQRGVYLLTFVLIVTVFWGLFFENFGAFK